MAEAVVSFVVERIGDFIIQEGKFLYRVRDQVELAQRELQLMKGFLKDADARQGNDKTVRIWVAKIREAAYDLEDVIEIYALKVACKREGGIKSVLKRFGCMLKEGVDLHKIGAEIRAITTNISDLRLSLQTYNIRELRESTEVVTSVYERQQQLRRTYSHIIDRDVVGLEESVRELAMHLIKSGDDHRVVSIWGMGGLGKTTLAKQVYHDNEVRQHFDCFAWVCISQQCQVRDVWEQILVKVSAVPRTEVAHMKEGEIAKKLHLVQQESKCLVVLDDIWNIETWESIKAAFPLCEETNNSRILLTTRKEEVALHSDRHGFLFQPRPLNDDESWLLLEKIAILGRKEINSGISTRMKELGKKMLEHCKGLPLAITVLAGLLARKVTVEEWDMVDNNVREYIRRGKDDEQGYTGASWLLALSYDDLPYHLKPCFLYLGNFPEDFEIPVKRLTQLWIAEGFVCTSQERMENVAYGYISELVERCVVQVGERGSIRKIKSCRLHDLMRDLCLLKVKEENFLQNVNFSHQNEATDQSSSFMVTNTTPISKVRRLSIYLNENVDKLVPLRNNKDSHIRSLLYFGPRLWMPRNKELVQSLFKDFKVLRVLKVEGMNRLVELPNEIGNMVHLRFLSLRDSRIARLPLSLGNLTCLQTLDFRFLQSEVVPDVIWKMTQLRHLYLPLYWRAHPKLRLSTLLNLQTLDHVSSLCSDLNDLTELRNLRKLGIRVTSPLRNLEETLKSITSTLDRIRSLFVHNLLDEESGMEVAQIVLSCRNIYKLNLNGRTVELPKVLHHYRNLTKLTLVRCDLKDNQMAVLEKLPNLKTLCLMEQTFEYRTTNTLVFSKGGFPQLECLSLICAKEIEDLQVEQGAMPSLCRLYIKSCDRLKTIPNGLRYLTTLRKLTLGMPSSFNSKLQVGGEDYYKVQHVPSIVFRNLWD